MNARSQSLQRKTQQVKPTGVGGIPVDRQWKNLEVGRASLVTAGECNARVHVQVEVIRVTDKVASNIGDQCFFLYVFERICMWMSFAHFIGLLAGARCCCIRSMGLLQLSQAANSTLVICIDTALADSRHSALPQSCATQPGCQTLQFLQPPAVL